MIGAAGRELRWLALRGSPAGNRPDIRHTPHRLNDLLEHKALARLFLNLHRRASGGTSLSTMTFAAISPRTMTRSCG
jgi:hypothetical protein